MKSSQEDTKTRIAVHGRSPIHSPRLPERLFHFNKKTVTEGLMAKLRPTDWAIYPVVGIAADYETHVCNWGQKKIADLAGIPQSKVSRSCNNIQRNGLFRVTRRPHGATRREQTNLIEILNPLPGDFFPFSGKLLINEDGDKVWANIPKPAMRVYIVLRAKVHNASLLFFYDESNTVTNELRDRFFDDVFYKNADFEDWFGNAHLYLSNDTQGEYPLPEGFLEPFMCLTPDKIKRYMELASIKDEDTFFTALDDLVEAGLLAYTGDYIFVFPRPLSI
jgi:hypothetical protein